MPLPKGITSVEDIVLNDNARLKLSIELTNSLFTEGAITPNLTLDLREIFHLASSDDDIIKAEFAIDADGKTPVEKEFYIESAATSREEIGNDIYPPAKRCLSAHGVPFSRHYARQITVEDYHRFDLILCMEEYNIRNLRRVLGDNIMQHDAALPQPKIRRLLNRDVADPWYTGDFTQTWADICEGIDRIMEELT